MRTKEGLELQISAHSTHMDALVSQVQDVQLQINFTSSRIDTVSSQVETSQSQMNATSSRVDTVSSQVKTAQSQTNATSSRVDTFSSQVQSVQSQLSSVSSRVNTVRSRVQYSSPSSRGSIRCRQFAASLAVESASVRSKVPVSVSALATRVLAGAPHRRGLRRSAMTPTGEAVGALTSGVLNVRERSEMLLRNKNDDPLLNSEIYFLA